MDALELFSITIIVAVYDLPPYEMSSPNWVR